MGCTSAKQLDFVYDGAVIKQKQQPAQTVKLHPCSQLRVVSHFGCVTVALSVFVCDDRGVSVTVAGAQSAFSDVYRMGPQLGK